jgi:hypothetical protein
MSQIRNTGNKKCFAGLLKPNCCYLYQESPVPAPISTPTTVQEWWGSGWTTFCCRQLRFFFLSQTHIPEAYEVGNLRCSDPKTQKESHRIRFRATLT